MVEGIRRLTKFMAASNLEIANYARIVGKNEVGKLEREDLLALNRDLSDLNGVKWLDGLPKNLM
jgi:methylamine---glutamate N-methyltransferase subunit C